MNPGAAEEAGRTASSLIEALRAQPVMLVLVLLQCITLGALLYSSNQRQKATSRQFDSLHQLLDKCLAGHIGP
jgi:uncharacterized membrane protein affecting hemolysin expression